MKDYTGQIINETKILGYAESVGTANYWWGKCKCGNIKKVLIYNLKHRKTNGCTCITVNSTHGMSGTPIYDTWARLFDRCYNKKNERYDNYGGRGIRVCKRWFKFENFYEDMGDRPEGASIDRINVNGNYTPKNCRWATKDQQANNKRNNIFLTYKGKTLTLMQWSRKLNVHYMSIKLRLEKGKTFKEIYEDKMNGTFGDIKKKFNKKTIEQIMDDCKNGMLVKEVVKKYNINQRYLYEFRKEAGLLCYKRRTTK